jgi:hypothetical protein
MSGTTQQGNRLDVVADTARTIGLVKEEEWSNNPKAPNWDTYYTPIPQQVISKAVKQPIQYEGIDISVENLKRELKHCPLQVTIPAPHPNHAIMLVHIEGNTAYYLDHYSPFLKTMDVSKITYALKILLTKPMNEFVKTVNYKGTVGVMVFADNVENYKFLCKQYNVTPQVAPDGTITTDLVI